MGFALPLILFRGLAIIGDMLRRCRLPAPWDSEQQAKLFGDLRFDAGKAMRELDWIARHQFAHDEGAA